MINVTVSVFSGRPNPTWVLDEGEALPLLKEIALHRGVLRNREAGFDGLGFRGIDIEFQRDDQARAYGLPPSFRIAHGASDDESKALEVAERFIAGMLGTTFAKGGRAAAGATPLDAALQQLLHKQLAWSPRGSTRSTLGSGAPKAGVLDACTIETAAYDTTPWNSQPYMDKNNCYNYASNRRTNTFAQPGLATGHQYTAFTCAALTAASLSDGLHQAGSCFPASEYPRWLMALVIAPGQDFHWYRKCTEGFWGHKPGHDAAKNTDNSGHVINDPENADRGDYTVFCGYLYGCKSQQIA